jgi:hypothetical protein
VADHREADHQWLHGFVLPLIAGGDVRVSEVIGQRELDRLVVAPLDRDEAALRIAEARQAVMAELLLDPPLPELDDEALKLAAAVQDLLFLSHPDARGPQVRKRRLAEVARFAASVAELLPPERALDLASRHSMLHHLFDLGRDDVRVTFWAGKREFRGAEPPPRLLKWGKVRRVREERWRVGLMSEAACDPPRRAIVLALLAASPLTDLLEPLRLDPPLELQPLARWLREPEIARAVADRWLSLGFAAIAGPITSALLALYEKEDPEAARLATRFVCHLHLLAIVARRSSGALLPELQAQLAAQPALRDFYGLFAAAQRLGLGRPDDVAKDPRLASAIDRAASACATLCGETRVRELVAQMARGTRIQLLAAPAEDAPSDQRIAP